MASSIQLLRSTIAQERPFPGNLLEGQPAVNLNSTEPGLFFKAADGSLVKFGPAAITSDGSPPNSTPQGSAGNTVGELWLDKSVSPAVLKIYDGAAWVDAGSGGGGGGSGSFVRWIYTAIGGETSLSGSSGGVLLQYTPGLEEVFINGVLITREVDYSAANGSSITNLTPLTAGDVVTVMSIIPLEVVQLPGQVTLLRWAILAAAGQTVLSGADSSSQVLAYEAGFEEVYVNGAFLRRGVDYDATNGTSITLTSPLSLSDEITVLAWSPFTVANQISTDEISFTQGGTTFNQTLTSKLGDSISVKDFGAVGDGTSDDTPYIQAAADALQSNGALFFPAGEYVINGRITYSSKSNIVIRGEKAKIRQTASNEADFFFDSCSKIAVKDLWFEGLGTERLTDGDWATSTSTNGVAAIYLRNCEDVLIDGNVITNHAGGGIRWGAGGAGAKNFRITNNTIQGIGGGAPPLKIQYLDARSDFAVSSGGGTTSADEGLIITGNDISGHVLGIGAGGRNDTNAPGIIIDSNRIHDIPGQHGIYLASASKVVISNNVIQDIAALGLKNQIDDPGYTANSTSVTNNVIANCGQSGINIVTASAPGAKHINVNIIGNTVKDVSDIGINCRESEEVNIEGNNVEDCGTFGIFLTNCQAKCTSNYVRRSGWNGLYFELIGDSYVQGNLFSDCCIDGTYTGTAPYLKAYAWAFKESTLVVNPTLVMSDNHFSPTAAVLPTLENSARVSSGVKTVFSRNTNLTGKAFRAEDLMYFDPGYTEGGAGLLTTAANSNPSTPISGKGTRQLYGSQDPSSAGMTSYFGKGDIVWNTGVAAGGNVGWVCITAGSPGVWKTFGTVSA